MYLFKMVVCSLIKIKFIILLVQKLVQIVRMSIKYGLEEPFRAHPTGDLINISHFSFFIFSQIPC